MAFSVVSLILRKLPSYCRIAHCGADFGGRKKNICDLAVLGSICDSDCLSRSNLGYRSLSQPFRNFGGWAIVQESVRCATYGASASPGTSSADWIDRSHSLRFAYRTRTLMIPSYCSAGKRAMGLVLEMFGTRDWSLHCAPARSS